MKMSKQNISGNTMKQYLLFLLLISAFAQAQIINFPDANFKARLLAANPSNNIATTNPNPFINTYNTTIDVNGNGEIERLDYLRQTHPIISQQQIPILS